MALDAITYASVKLLGVRLPTSRITEFYYAEANSVFPPQRVSRYACFVVLLLLVSLPRLYADGVIYQINCGGPAAFPAVPTRFACDAYGSGGYKYSTSTTVDTSAVVGPAPQSAYQTERYGQVFSYSFPNLVGGASYIVRLHFAEYRYGAIGYNNKPARLFNVSINSKAVLSNFDVYATAGAKYKAVTETFSTTADSNGKITINFNGGTDNAEIKAIEILGQQVHIDVNNVGTTTDDLVRLTSDTPARKFTTPCTIQALGTQSADLSVSLSCPNGAGRVGFDKVASAGTKTSTLNLSLPKDGTPVTFYIVGDVKSNAIGDANIQVVDAISKQVYGAQPVTVFWFGSPIMSTSTASSYVFTDDVFHAGGTDNIAINLMGQTRLMPNGISASAPQIQRLQLGIEQNFISGLYQITWTPKTITWEDYIPSGTSTDIPASRSRTYRVPNSLDTIDPSDVPLYDRRNDAKIKIMALVPLSVFGITQVNSADGPFQPASPHGPLGAPYQAYVTDRYGNRVPAATVDYDPSVSIYASVRNWLVVYDANAPAGQQTQQLSETGW